MTFKKSLLIFLLIAALGLFLRCYKLGNQSLIADENIGMHIAYGYNQSGEWKFWDFNSDKLTDEKYTRSKIYYWQVAKLFDFVKVNEANSRLVSVMWGMIGLGLIFFATYYYTRKAGLALIAALLLSISLSALLFDRKLRMYAMFSPVYFAFALSIYQLLEGKCKSKIEWLKKLNRQTGINWIYFPVVALLGFISIRTHLLTVNMAPTILIFLLVMGGWVFYKKRKWFNKYFILLACILAAAPFVISNHYFQDALKFFSPQDNWGYIEDVFLDYGSFVLPLILLILGTIYLIYKFKKWGAWVSCCFWVPLLLAIFSWDRNTGEQYIYFIQIFKDIIVASAIYLIAKEVSNKIFHGNRKFFAALAIGLILILFNFEFLFSKDSYYMDIKDWNHSNHRESYFYLKNNFGKNEILITRSATNFYLWRWHIPTIDYGVSRELVVQDIKKAQKNYDGIWVIYSRTTDIDGDAEDYIEENFKLEEDEYTNDKVLIWHWEKDKDKN